jgi:hypothetical protein
MLNSAIKAEVFATVKVKKKAADSTPKAEDSFASRGRE